MRQLLIFFIALLFTVQSTETIAQTIGNDWRVSKKVKIENNGQKFSYEYSYNSDGLIETVKYFSSTGALTNTITDFTFNRNKKPVSYTVVYNRDRVNATVAIEYDNAGKMTKLTKTLPDNDVTIFTYRYTANTVIVSEKKLNNTNVGSSSKLVFFNERGDYLETSKDAETGIITTVNTLNKDREAIGNANPENFMGGFVAPDFLGIVAFSSMPKLSATKDKNGLITGITLASTSVTRKYEYTYVDLKDKPNSNPPADQHPTSIIKTNITCDLGKRSIEMLLKKQDGVVSADVDIRNGDLKLNYSSDGTSYNDIVKLINDQGFDADGKRSRNPEKNNCATKPTPAESAIKVTIQTNITCRAAEEKVLNDFRQLDGIVDVKINIATGKVEVEYKRSTTNLPQIISVINNQGYDADNKKSSTPEKNLCSPIIKTNDTISVTIQTDIKCAEGKQKVEAELKAQAGVISAVVDSKTGKVSITYNQKYIQAVQLNKIINGEGFETDGKASDNPEDNPCTGKKPPVTTSTIQGKLFYRYKTETEQPKETSFSFPSGMKAKKLNNPPYNTSILVPNTDPYPDVICNGFFEKTNETRQLKYGKINLVYTILTSTVENPKQYKDLRGLTGEELYNYSHTSALFGSEFNAADKIVATGSTDVNGNFSISFDNNLKIGSLGSDVIEGQKKEIKVDKYGKTTTVYTPDGTSVTVYKYGVLRLALQENYFSNSDMILFPKPGKTITIPDEVIIVQSHNVQVTVKTDASIQDQALTPGALVDAYPVRLVAVAATYPSPNSSFPIESNSEAYKELKTSVLNQPAKVLDLGKTSVKGIYIFKNLASSKNIIEATEQKLEGNYVYETTTQLQYDDTPDNDFMGVKFSSNFSINKLSSALGIGTTKKEIIIKPKLPEIYLRAITQQSGKTIGIPFVKVTVTTYTGSESTNDEYTTDNNGYLHLYNLPLKTQKENGKTKIIGPTRTIVLSKAGYSKKIVADKQQLQFGERFPAKPEQLMDGAGKVVGHVENEKGEPVVCNVRVGSGPYIKTASNGWFYIDNCQTGVQIIEIVPSVDNYFPEKLLRNINDDYTIHTNVTGNKDGKIVVKEKLHRVQFKIVDENNKIITQSCTSVGDNLSECFASSATTGLTKEISIASPSNEFRVRTQADGYVTYDDYALIPVSKTAKIITIKLTKGQQITGVVRDAKTQKGIKNARVYTINGTNEDGEIQNETFTDDNGNYVLKGVISQTVWMQNVDASFQVPVSIYAVKSGEPCYLRAMKKTDGSTNTVDFELTPLEVKAEIWGLPIEITSAKQNKSKTITISGAFVKLPANNTFKPLMANVSLPFKDVEVNIEKSKLSGLPGKNTGDEQSKIIPVKNSIDLETTAFKVTAFNKFGCEVIGTLAERNVEKLTVTNNNGCGNINGFVTSELSSFNFSYNYNGKFLLGSKTKAVLPVLSAKDCDVSKTTFELSALYGKSNFNIHNFNAEMGTGSYVNKDGFFINADVKLQIPLVEKQKMPAGQIQVLTNNIIWNEYNGEINLPLEKWSVTGKGLRYDINQGGFRVIDGNLQTDLPKVPLKDLIINPTSIDLGLNSFTGNEKLSLSDVAPLNLTPGAKIDLTYDAATAFDQKPHYRLNISSSKETVAYISKIPGINSADKIKINLFSAYSDGIHKSIIVKPEDHLFYNIVSQTITGIEVADKSFTLIGNTNLNIPGANNNVTGRFIYYKDEKDNTKDVNGVVCKVQKLQTDIEMPGKVKFNGTNFQLSDNLLVVKGDVIVYKETASDGFTVTGTLTKTPSATKMDLDALQLITMGKSGGRALEIQSGGGNAVTGKEWSLVKFTAKPKGYTTNGKEILKPGNDLIDFIVKGAMVNDPLSDKKVGVEGIETPFGGIAISLDFEKKILQGSLTMKQANIPLGPVVIQDGTIDLQIDSKGFIMVGAITNADIAIPLLSGFKSGVAIGFYDGALPQYMTNNLLDVTLYKELPDLKNGLKGFYVNVMKSLGKSDFPTLPGPSLDKIPIVGSFVPTIDFNGGIDLRTSINLQNGPSIIIGGLAFAEATCLYNIEDVCNIGLGAGAKGEVELKYSKGLTGFIKFDVYGKIYYCVGEKALGINLTLEKTPTDFKPSVSLK